jgi:branched-chain amino acid transport system permease protein
VLIYRTSRVLNLAHGELMMVAAYLLLTTASLFSGHPLTAVAASAVLGLVVGIAVYVVLMRKMTGERVLAAVLATVALGILLRGIVVLVWSAQQQYPGQALGWSNPALVLPGGARISAAAAALVLTTSRSCATRAGAFACARPARTRCSPPSAGSGCTACTHSRGGSPPSPAGSRGC